MIQRRLAWPLRKDDTQNREAFHIFWLHHLYLSVDAIRFDVSFSKVWKKKPNLDLWKSWVKHPCSFKSSTYSCLFGFKLICWFDGCTLCSHPTMNHIWNIVKKTFIMWNSARHAKTTISAIYCLGIWCLIFSNFNVLASAVHILKLERYRED